MPIRIADNLPARHILEQERIFVMEENRALTQDIRPIRIVILNLMPDKSVTETQLLRALSNSPIQVDIELLFTRTHQSTHTPAEHLIKYYRTFPEVSRKEGQELDPSRNQKPDMRSEFEFSAHWR